MKAIILAAGKGERLKKITQSVPKPMIKYRGKPILEYNIELCKKHGIEDIYINLYHLPKTITDYFLDGKRLGVNIKYSYENELLGTAGAVRKIVNDFWNIPDIKSQSLKVSESLNQQHSSNVLFRQAEPFFVIYGDNFSDYDLQLLIDKQKKTKAPCVIAFHYREDVSQSGVAEFDHDFKIIKFIEKPKDGDTQSHWVNAGIYLMSTEIIKYIDEGNNDFGKDVFPKILKSDLSIYGVCQYTEVRSFDTPRMFYDNIKEKNKFNK